MHSKIKYITSIFYISTFISLSANAAEKPIYDEGIQTLQKYLRINTTNPTGNEMKTAKFLKQILDKEGIENKIFDLGHGRANLYAVLRGNGSKKPIVMLHHMDVVPSEKKFWSVDPFGGKIINGEIYGRGAIDIKGKGILDLMTMLSLKRSKFPLKRDLILLAVADEEVNSIGSKWIIKNKPELVKNAEFLIDEGQTVVKDKNNRIMYYSVAIGEKSPLWLTLTFTGKPGHGSIPIDNSSVNQAVRAANKIINYKTQFNVLPGMEESLRLNIKGDISKIAGYKNDLATSLKSKQFLEQIAKDPEVNALIRNTISVTSLKGSGKINTIPNEASISLDCRLMPGVNKDNFIEELKSVINDKNVKIKVEEYFNSKYSSADTDFIAALKRHAKKTRPDLKVVPTLLTSSTDSSLYRGLGINVYGFESYKADDDEADTAHGNDERLSIEGFKFGMDLFRDVVKDLNK